MSGYNYVHVNGQDVSSHCAETATCFYKNVSVIDSIRIHTVSSYWKLAPDSAKLIEFAKWVGKANTILDGVYQPIVLQSAEEMADVDPTTPRPVLHAILRYLREGRGYNFDLLKLAIYIFKNYRVPNEVASRQRGVQNFVAYEVSPDVWCPVYKPDIECSLELLSIWENYHKDLDGSIFGYDLSSLKIRTQYQSLSNWYRHLKFYFTDKLYFTDKHIYSGPWSVTSGTWPEHTAVWYMPKSELDKIDFPVNKTCRLES